ncbi:MAG: hypothetical protein ACJ8AT_05180 [Hyalangium sp.]|uniref:hypothetical protein n=1 Tax=Hyalangium sp. TaxID=2028555 RepID=UPI00389A4507
MKKASARIPGTTVLPAGLAKHAEVGDDGNKYLFGTGGVLRFLEPQSYEQLEAIVRLVADTFIADRFDVVEPLEVVREPGN